MTHQILPIQPLLAPETGAPSTPDATALAQEADVIAGLLQEVRTEIGRVVFGQRDVVDQALVSILSGGHALLVGAPGLGKTLLVTTLGTVLGLDSRRVQFTPDLMPSDITGSEILDEDASGHRSFRFIPGPVFCQLLMADEINRASPRTQSALLQAMQEHKVAIAGTEYPLPRPFHVLATQNPIDQEGTYPLPEAQLDRFMLQINLAFPDEADERAMLLATTGNAHVQPRAVLSAEKLIAAQMMVRALPVGERIVDAILKLVRMARPETSDVEQVRDAIAWGPGPRAAQTLMLATRARALLDGRLSPSLDDIAALAVPVLAHRMALSFSARADSTRVEDVIAGLVQRLG
ncbi:MoxR family ATPase [Acetobacter estunensis]|uniref:AAA family ATPase n=1 Tax=Acetobacter estunensis TaxID=104097 RepID=UPI001C2D8215|nr:MoxR family ATPase [Acetobacter estunensis]MBV1838366.1 MoxR family ATPase [Acetobacter estunensis]